MPLDLIGAGFGRTGTSSIAKALSDLGYPCYHMNDVLFNPAHKDDVTFWNEVATDPDGAERDWNRVFSRHRAVLDFPACAAWRGMAKALPEAKVILTLHAKGAEAWYDSTVKTIFKGTDLGSNSAFGAQVNEMMDALIWNGMLAGTMTDRDAAIARYEAHIEEVRAALPPERLLIFSADQGWEPLCAFLDLPVPEADFPNVNNREDMARRMARLEMMRRFTAKAGAK